MHKCLVIDDEKPVFIAITKLGHWSSYHLEKPLYAENGRDAMEILRREKPAVVFVDMQMPVMSGSEFLREASGLSRSTGFIVVSGYDEFQYAQNAIRCGAMDYLLKPVAEDALNEAIDKTMHTLYPEEDFQEEESTGEMSAQDVVALLHDTIERNYTDNIRLQDFADEYFFSKEYLSRLFKNTYGIGISEYLTKVRMERASELILRQEITISDIASRVGYSDNAYFSKVFRAYFGKTPSEYRALYLS